MNTWLDHLVLLPVLLPLAGVAAGLALWRRPRAGAWAVLLAMGLALGFSSVLLAVVLAWGEPVVLRLGGWPEPVGIVLVGDVLAAAMAVMSQLVLFAGILYGLGCHDKCARYPAFFPLFSALGAGLTGVMLTGDLFNFFVFAELLVISGAALTAVSDDRTGTEAAYKYFYISMVAAIALLLASGSLYATCGTLNFAELARALAAGPAAGLARFGMVMLLAAMMVKSAVLPLHFWQPDFHTAAPTPVHAVLSSVVVKVGIYGFIRMTTLLFVADAELIRQILLVLGSAGVLFGSLGATGTYDAKRMLAYSTLGQLGFILVALGWGSAAALAAAIVFAVNHSLAKAAMLMLAGAVASRAPVKSAAFSVITGLGRYRLFAGALFLLGGMALAGLPPTNGFISKLMVFQSGIAGGHWGALALLVLASVVSLVYVGRSFQAIWWQTPPADVQPKPYGDALLAPTLLIGGCVVLGVWPTPLVRLAEGASLWLTDPEPYIRAVLGP
ncbi:MAG: complex I subunit 5 family protein [Phycisphaeraceae bacterium]